MTLFQEINERGLTMPDLPIRLFCWLGVQPRVRQQMHIEDLTTWARSEQAQAPSSAFVVHDLYWRASAVILPDAVLSAVNHFGLPPHASYVGSGLYDFLRSGQVMIDSDTPARQAIRLVVQENASLMLAVNKAGYPVGVLVPDSLRATLADGVPGVIADGTHPTLARRVRELSAGFHANLLAADSDPQAGERLIDIIDAIDEELHSFHSESFNHRNPTIGRCADHGQPHLTPLPCPTHARSASVSTVILRT